MKCLTATCSLVSALTLSISNAAYAGTPTSLVYCIDDATEFTSVLNTLNSKTSHEENYELRFRPGTFPSNTSYPASGNTNALIAWRPRWVTAYPNYRFKISGEWNAGCTAQNARGGTASTINGLDLYAIFYVAEVGYSAQNYTPLVVEIDRIDFWRFASFGVQSTALGGEHDIRITSSRFRAGTGMAVLTDFDTSSISNSLFENNSTGNNAFTLVDVDAEGQSYTSNNTFRNNTLPSAGGSRVLIRLGNPLTETPSGLSVFENNIIYQTTLSTSSELVQTDTLARVRNNIFDFTSVSGTPLFFGNNYDVNPMFSFSAGAQLNANSPARDIGNNASINGATFDLYGRTRIQNQVVDIGAYEITPSEAFFADSFE